MKKVFGFCLALIFLCFLVFLALQKESPPFISEQRVDFFLSALVDFKQDLEQRQLKDYGFLRDKLIADGLDFLEINLSAMQVRLYKKGELEKQANILLKGDASRWGGTSAGLYYIVSGGKKVYSVAAEAFMPWALNFYGKYYIHGEPTDIQGNKLISDVSGGCLRLADEDAEDFYNLTEIGMMVVVIDKENDSYFYKPAVEEPPELTAGSYLVADLDSGFILAEKQASQKRQIASLAKLMTAVIVAENMDLTRSILVRDYMLDGWGETETLKEGERFRVVELFYPLLIESSNDAAEALSRFLGRDRTIELMNQKAKSILMPDTTFSCPSGYDEGNVSTCHDLFYLARYIFNNRPPLLEITRGEKVLSFGGVKFDIEELWNKNIFSEDESFIGGKTGFIKTSGYTGLFIFKFKDDNERERNIVFILLGSDHLETSKTDTQKLYLWVQKNFFHGKDNF